MSAIDRKLAKYALEVSIGRESDVVYPSPAAKAIYGADMRAGLAALRSLLDAAPALPAGLPDVERLADIHAADMAASLVHDFIWQRPVLSGTTPPSQEQASDAIWTIHRVLRPLLAALEGSASLRDQKPRDRCPPHLVHPRYVGPKWELVTDHARPTDTLVGCANLCGTSFVFRRAATLPSDR